VELNIRAGVLRLCKWAGTWLDSMRTAAPSLYGWEAGMSIVEDWLLRSISVEGVVDEIAGRELLPSPAQHVAQAEVDTLVDRPFVQRPAGNFEPVGHAA